ncbi:MAG: RidA family protein [Erysipelothrix sp.]|nr:RidA family protein [Erysipelothrix sp.]
MKRSITIDPEDDFKNTFSKVLKVGDNVYVSAMMADHLDENPSFSEQTHSILNKINDYLKTIKLDLSYVVKVQVYGTDKLNLEALDDIFKMYFKNPYPARDVAIVDHLAEENASIQISLEAIDYRASELMKQWENQICEDGVCEYI